MCSRKTSQRKGALNRAGRKSWKNILDRGRKLLIPSLSIHLVGWGVRCSLESPNAIIRVLSKQQVPNKDILRGDFSNCRFQKVPAADDTIWAVGTLGVQPRLSATAATAAPVAPDPGSLCVAHLIMKQVSGAPGTFSAIRAESEQGLYLYPQPSARRGDKQWVPRQLLYQHLYVN